MMTYLRWTFSNCDCLPVANAVWNTMFWNHALDLLKEDSNQTRTGGRPGCGYVRFPWHLFKYLSVMFLISLYGVPPLPWQRLIMLDTLSYYSSLQIPKVVPGDDRLISLTFLGHICFKRGPNIKSKDWRRLSLSFSMSENRNLEYI